MTFKPQQVLRTKVPLKAAEGKQVSPQTRVVVMQMADGRVKVKIADPRLPDLAGVRLESTPAAFVKTQRGRPTKEK
jgi:hypothetical protein